MSIPSAKKILIVEDEKDILQLVKLYLEKEGYRTVTASTGSEGLAQVRTGKPDLIVLDLMLDRKSTRLNSSHVSESRMPSSA